MTDGGKPREEMAVSVKGFLETSFLDWPGKLAAVVFLPGCNFRCPFCHNRELVEAGEDLPEVPLPFILDRLERLRGWVDGVVVTGGEPTLHDGLPDLLRAFREAGFLVKLDTNGSRPELLGRLIGEELVDGVDMDLKAPLGKEPYDRLAGVPVDLGAIGRSVELLRNARLPHRFRTTYVPGLLDEPSIRELARFVAPSSEYVLQPFDPRRTLDAALGEVSPPGDEEMGRLRELVSEAAG
jgi:pyruvate formate lyase activating enzyme